MNANARLDKIVEDLKGYSPEKIILFGSAAKGDMDEFSDIDIILVKETDRPFVKRLRDVALLCPADIVVDVLVYTPREIADMRRNNHFIEKVMAEGKVLYER